MASNCRNLTYSPGGQKSAMVLRTKIKMSADCIPFWRLQGGNSSFCLLNCWGNYFLVVIGLRGHFLAWYYVEAVPLLLGVTCFPWLMAPSFIFKASNGRLNCSHDISFFLHLISLIYSLCFKCLMWLEFTHLYNLSFLHLKACDLNHICKVLSVM